MSKYIDIKQLKRTQLNAKTPAKIHIWANMWNKTDYLIYTLIYSSLIYSHPNSSLLSLWSILLKTPIPFRIIWPPWSLKTNLFFIFMVMEFMFLGNIRQLRELSAFRWHKKLIPIFLQLLKTVFPLYLLPIGMWIAISPSYFPNLPGYYNWFISLTWQLCIVLLR